MDVIIVGAGLAGLACARALHRQRFSSLVVEAADDIGGRVRTDDYEGYLLDRGFQVLLTSYPEAQRVFDYSALDVRCFQPGAMVRFQGKFHRFVDPWRKPKYLFSTLRSPLATLGDKLRVARLRRQVCGMSLEQIAREPEQTTREALAAAGFSERIMQTFFRSFLGGVFLDRELSTSSRMLKFVMQMFATGEAALPAAGMGSLARQLASDLPDGTIWTNTPVAQVHEGARLTLADGRKLSAKAIVLATPAPVTAKLLGLDIEPTGRSVTCFYFAADRPPIEEPILLLNGEGTGPIQNLCVPSQVCPSYAPAGKALVSVSVVGVASDEPELHVAVISQLHNWFGDEIDHWNLLRAYPIDYALPSETPALPTSTAAPSGIDSLYICGDHTESASIQGALVSGRRTADRIAARLAGGSQTCATVST